MAISSHGGGCGWSSWWLWTNRPTSWTAWVRWLEHLCQASKQSTYGSYSWNKYMAISSFLQVVFEGTNQTSRDVFLRARLPSQSHRDILVCFEDHAPQPFLIGAKKFRKKYGTWSQEIEDWTHLRRPFLSKYWRAVSKPTIDLILQSWSRLVAERARARSGNQGAVPTKVTSMVETSHDPTFRA